MEFDSKAALETERAYQTDDIRTQRRKTQLALRLQPGERVLDIGCGSGLLAAEMAQTVGPTGAVLGIDISREMLALAQARCESLPQVRLEQRELASLHDHEAQFDAAVCTQVLLYLTDVADALQTMARLLRPGGRLVIVETDWRGLVLNSYDHELTERIAAAWDAAVPSPNLPVQLPALLRQCRFTGIEVEAIPIINTELTPDHFCYETIRHLAHHARASSSIKTDETDRWMEDLHQKQAHDAFFFSINRFLFTAHRP